MPPFNLLACRGGSLHRSSSATQAKRTPSKRRCALRKAPREASQAEKFHDKKRKITGTRIQRRTVTPRRTVLPPLTSTPVLVFSQVPWFLWPAGLFRVFLYRPQGFYRWREI
jgi:hypothetical protein